MKPTHIAIVAFDQFTDIDVFLAWDLFNRVRDPQWQVQLVGTAPQHVSVNNLRIDMGADLTYANQADIVFFASGPGTRKLYKDQQYLSQLQLDPSRQLIGSMCSGSLILAALHLLPNGKATTYPTSRPELEAMGIEVQDADLVVDGNVATAAGCLAALDLVGWMLERHAGPELRDYVLNSVQPVTKGLVCSYGVPVPVAA